MAEYKGINVPDSVVPFTSEDTYPIFEDIHGRGGLHAVSSILERDAIFLPRRKVGMIVSVAGDALYTLVGGVSNTNWVKIEIFTASFFTTIEEFTGDANDSIILDLTLLTPNNKLPVIGDIINDPNDRSARVTDVDEMNNEVSAIILEDSGRKPVSNYEEDALLIKDYFILHNGKLARIIDTFTSANEGNIDESFNKDIEDGNLELISDAVSIVYDNKEYPDLDTVAKALDHILYVELAVNLSGGGVFEIGYTVPSLSLSWTINKTIVSQSLNHGIGILNANDRSFIDNMININNDVTYTLIASDDKKTVDANTSFIFRPRRFWGISPEESLTDTQILALAGTDLTTGRAQTRSFDCTGGNFFYFAIPSVYGIPNFRVGGFSYSNYILTTRDVENQFGEIINYNVFRSGLIQTGANIIVELT